MAKNEEIRRKYQVWSSPDKTEFTFSAADQMNVQKDKENGLMDKDAYLLHEIEASTYEEAMSIYYLRVGFEPYKPNGSPELCPRCRGSYFYPKGSGQCPYCGDIC